MLVIAEFVRDFENYKVGDRVSPGLMLPRTNIDVLVMQGICKLVEDVETADKPPAMETTARRRRGRPKGSTDRAPRQRRIRANDAT